MQLHLMDFVESRLLGVQVDETGREVELSFVGTDKAKFVLELHGVERLLINEFRQQNVVEEVVHWTRAAASEDLREAAFFLMTGSSEKDCQPQLAAVAQAVVDRVIRGELEVIGVSAVFGAQVLASFESMTIRKGT